MDPRVDPRVARWRHSVHAGSLMRRLEGTWIFLIIYYKINLYMRTRFRADTWIIFCQMKDIWYIDIQGFFDDIRDFKAYMDGIIRIVFLSETWRAVPTCSELH